MPPTNPLRFFFHVSRPYVGWVFAATVVVIIGSIIGQSLPLFYKWIIEAIEVGDVQYALWLGLLYPAAVFVESLFWRLSGVLGMKWSTWVKVETNTVLTEYTMQHGKNYFSNHFAGALLNKASNVIGGMETFVHDFLWTLLGIVVGTIVTLGYLFAIDAGLAGIFLLLLIVLFIFNYVLMDGKQVRSRTQAELGSRLRGMIADSFGNAATVRHFSGYHKETADIHTVALTWRNAGEKSWLYSEVTQFLNGVILFIFFAAMMYYLISGWGGDVATTGELVFVIALVSSLTGRLVFVGRVMNNLARVVGEVEEGLSALIVPHDIVDSVGAVPLVVTQGRIDCTSVRFLHEETLVFDNLHLSITPGQRVGLVGSSGAGKSTLVSLLLREHSVASGVIAIDGQNIDHVTQDSLRSAIAVVPQEPALFHRTIRENIVYGKPQATDEEVYAVAKKAYAHDFIMSLPLQYDTLVGERGVKLSGGQKQRIAIARAMLKDAPILILDEATSALDSESEVAIQRALHQLMTGKTVLAIAHRLSTLREMDRIIVLDGGRILEDGTHDSLLAYGGVYASLWRHQAGGFVGE